MRKSKFNTVTLVALTLALTAALALPASAETITLYRGADVPELGIINYNGTIDVRMIGASPNYGGGISDVYAGGDGDSYNERSLIRFDLSDLAGLTVTADATFSLKNFGKWGSPNSSDYYDLHRIYSTNRGFNEGNGGDPPPDADAAPTWNEFAHHSTTPIPWRDSSGAGDYPGLGAAGEGYESSPIATLNESSYTGGAVVGVWVDITIPQATMQSLIDDNDFELLFRKRDETDTGRVAFHSAEDSGEEPRLIITAVPEPATLVLLAAGGLMALLFGFRARRRRA